MPATHRLRKRKLGISLSIALAVACWARPVAAVQPRILGSGWTLPLSALVSRWTGHRRHDQPAWPHTFTPGTTVQASNHTVWRRSGSRDANGLLQEAVPTSTAAVEKPVSVRISRAAPSGAPDPSISGVPEMHRSQTKRRPLSSSVDERTASGQPCPRGWWLGQQHVRGAQPEPAHQGGKMGRRWLTALAGSLGTRTLLEDVLRTNNALSGPDSPNNLTAEARNPPSAAASSMSHCSATWE